VALGKVEEGGTHPGGSSKGRWRKTAVQPRFWCGGASLAVLIGGGGVLQHEGWRGVREQPPSGGRTGIAGAHRGGGRTAGAALILSAVTALRSRGAGRMQGGSGEGHARSGRGKKRGRVMW
jgi:hypothetical protein